MGMMAPVFESPIQAPTLPEVHVAPEEHDVAEAELDPPRRIIVHNKDVTNPIQGNSVLNLAGS